MIPRIAKQPKPTRLRTPKQPRNTTKKGPASPKPRRLHEHHHLQHLHHHHHNHHHQPHLHRHHGHHGHSLGHAGAQHEYHARRRMSSSSSSAGVDRSEKYRRMARLHKHAFDTLAAQVARAQSEFVRQMQWLEAQDDVHIGVSANSASRDTQDADLDQLVGLFDVVEVVDYSPLIEFQRRLRREQRTPSVPLSSALPGPKSADDRHVADTLNNEPLSMLDTTLPQHLHHRTQHSNFLRQLESEETTLMLTIESDSSSCSDNDVDML